MPCRNISPKIFSESHSLEDAFRALGVLRQKSDGSGEAPPRLVFPDGYQAEEMPYLSGNDHLTFNVAPLFANGREQLNCSLKTLGYNADRAQQIDKESNDIKDDAEYDKYMANLTPQDAMNYNIYNTLKVLDYFRTDAVTGNTGAGGNTDGNADLISTKELDAWAWEVSGHDNDKFFKQGGDVVARLHSLVGLVTLLNSPAPATSADKISVDAGKGVDLAAPKTGWRSGDQVFIDGKEAALTVPSSGNGALAISEKELPAGDHKIEIRRANGETITTPVTVAPPKQDDAGTPNPANSATPSVLKVEPADGGTPPPAKSDSDQGDGLFSWISRHPGTAIGLGLGLPLAGGLIAWLASRNRGGTPPTNGGGNSPTDGNDNGPKRKAHPDAETAIQQEEQERADPGIPRNDGPKPPPLPQKTVLTKPKKVVFEEPKSADVDDMSDVLENLSAAKQNQTPPSGGTTNNVSPKGVTADNVIISGANAAPVSGLDPQVVRSQIVLQFREFLSQTAREALEDGKPLPIGANLVNSTFDREVSELTDKVMSEYYTRTATKEGKEAIADLWENQRGERGFIIRRGVPQNLLREIVGDYIAEHSQSSSSPFAGGVGAEMRTEAERHSGESGFFKRGMAEVLRSIGR